MPPVTRMVTKHRKKQQKIIDLVKCVIREQPDQKERALNCDGHGVYRKEFYKGKIPDEWMCEMDSLVSTHEGIFDHQYNTLFYRRRYWITLFPLLGESPNLCS